MDYLTITNHKLLTLPSVIIPSFMTKKIIALLICAWFLQSAQAQTPFPERCRGIWQGTMLMYNQNRLMDSVRVKLTVAALPDSTAWTWKTEYLSAKMPMTKDYIMRLQDLEKGLYLTDEGEGLVLTEHLFGDKLFGIFETSGYLLTSTYELRGNELIFEVTSGAKPAGEPSKDEEAVINYPVTFVQRVIFKKQ